ncbi:MAG: hypothetical protein K5891_00015 [Lachnospiraceae bacterium]|nr:hypothetical protein [Lachnospiraceae bacterium]
MALMDEFKEEREEIKNRPFKERFAYYFGYYKWHAFAVVVALITVISLIHHFATLKTTVLYTAFVNATLLDGKDAVLTEPFAALTGTDLKKEAFQFDDTIYLSMSEQSEETMVGVQKMAALIYSGDLDVLISKNDYFAAYAYQEVCVDPAEYLDPAVYEELVSTGQIYYIDLAFLRRSKEASEQGEEVPAEEMPDPLDPSKMQEPVAAGLALKECKTLDGAVVFREEGPLYVGVLATSKRSDMAEEFVAFLLRDLNE